MIKLICPNKLCGHRWNYTGKSRFFACCPKCHANVRVEPLKKKTAYIAAG